jgi:Putative auto-transporter adhesin, head GIN domain
MLRSRPLTVTTWVAFVMGVMVIAACSSPQTSPSALQGTGAIKTEVRSISDFTNVEIRHGMRLELAIGSPAKVELIAQENLLPICTTTVADGTLTVDATRDYSSADGITVKVTTPALSELVLVGGASGSATGVTATALTIRTDSGAILALSGTADSLELTAKGGGRLDFGAFTARDATVDLAGGLKVTLGVSRSVKGSATGGVALILRGSPSSVDVSTTGGAVVTQE